MKSSSVNEKSFVISFVKPVALGLIFGAVTIFALLFAGSAVMKHSNVPQTIIPIIAIISVAAGSFVAGFCASKISKQRGLLTGLVCGVAISLIILLAGLAVLKDSIGGLALTKFAASISASAIGGIVGVNTKRRR